MFNIEFLNIIRSHELAFYKAHLPARAKLLEIGGGTGIQAKQLSEAGFDVTSIDVSDSNYSGSRVFQIIEYDGKTIPFPDEEFDVVFSSNVLEHIRDLDIFHAEMNRVLKRDGLSFHAMPSGSWRFWTIVAHYLEAIMQIVPAAVRLIPRGISVDELRRIKYRTLDMLRILRNLLFPPPRHGEFGNCITEIYTFSHYHWERHFRRNHYDHIEVLPMGLFYTGHMIFGKRLSLQNREYMSRFLGSACILYKVSRTHAQTSPATTVQI